jgi:hypothetical protein
MSDKSNKYGYVGVDIPAQSFGSNKGVFNPAEINDLVANNQWTTFGQLELIETQTYSGTVTYIDFTSLGSYNVHFLTAQNFKSVSSNGVPVGIQLYESGTLETASIYQYALQVNATNANSEDRSTTSNIMKICTTATGSGVGKPYNFYCYLYNLTDSSKYSFQTSHGFGHDAFAGAGTVMNTHFGSSVLPQTSAVDGIRITTSTGINIGDFDISLYGIRYS